MEPTFFIPDITLTKRRTTLLRLELYDESGDALPIAADDELRAKVWATDDATPDIDADTGTTDSKVIVNSLGSSGVPADVTVRFHEDDTATLTAGTAYTFELHLVDHSDSDLAKPVCRANVTVLGTPTGNSGP